MTQSYTPLPKNLTYSPVNEDDDKKNTTVSANLTQKSEYQSAKKFNLPIRKRKALIWIIIIIIVIIVNRFSKIMNEYGLCYEQGSKSFEIAPTQTDLYERCKYGKQILDEYNLCRKKVQNSSFTPKLFNSLSITILDNIKKNPLSEHHNKNCSQFPDMILTE